MEQHGEVLNRFLVEVFNEILKTEENALAKAYKDLSLRELHLIEEVCRAADEGRDNRATAIAAAQRVTAKRPTATTPPSPCWRRRATWSAGGTSGTNVWCASFPPPGPGRPTRAMPDSTRRWWRISWRPSPRRRP